MNILEEKTKEIEEYLITERQQLIWNKISFFALLVLGMVIEYVQTLKYKYKYHVSWTEWNLIQLMIFLAIIIPFLLMPLYKYILDRKMNKYLWEIKYSLFEHVLKKYNTDYKISYNSCLPDQDIKNLKL